MRIYSMTATFGKLENQTLTLQPGLNVIHASNEWGKSTWCAFLLNMLYGIDTKERTKQDSVADKDRYAPWSGAAMSGKIDLCWNGRDITIERSSNQRVPLGNFRAYETDTGIDVPELNANNCGQMLLGVERNVFARAGFLKLSDLPVTQDDALRRRLNNLVTTGDEGSDADKLRESLKNLKNKCRSNRANGLIPEAEAEYNKRKEQLWELQELTDRNKQLDIHRRELKQQLAALENHKVALAYAASRADAQKVADAKLAVQNAQQRAASLEEAVKVLPSLEEAQAACQQISQLQTKASLLLQQQHQLPEKPAAPAVPVCFTDMTPQQALENAQKDLEKYQTLEANRKKAGGITTWLGILMLVVSVGVLATCLLIDYHIALVICSILTIVAGVSVLLVNKHLADKRNAELQKLFDRYPGQPAKMWVPAAVQYGSEMADYENKLESYLAQTGDYSRLQAEHQAELAAFAGEQTLAQRQDHYEQTVFLWQELDRANRELTQIRQHAQDLEAMAKTAPAPQQPDSLTYTARETEDIRLQVKQELQQVGESIAQNNGRMDAIGHPGVIRAKLEQLSRRISQLEAYNSAIELAQDYLYKTTLTLQRRFSPRITRRTQELFSKLTGGRYQRITLGEDMSLETAATDEVTLRELRRRSDGTIDQLYLALRLAVAGELTPEAPLVLDDALVRFDDTRLGLAMDILEQEAENKQVILFTCQNREEAYLAGK
ncbi:MAG: AAA family ATPase [Oscillospiraceae bacterium]|nr:AAA family ATPase [Oscillospiraceae bacterium]